LPLLLFPFAALTAARTLRRRFLLLFTLLDHAAVAIDLLARLDLPLAKLNEHLLLLEGGHILDEVKVVLAGREVLVELISLSGQPDGVRVDIHVLPASDLCQF
jgi:hypothetical protein